ncbi:MAG: hypothetical protein R2991_07300 [Thermoanaerobaculia bacterium]
MRHRIAALGAIALLCAAAAPLAAQMEDKNALRLTLHEEPQLAPGGWTFAEGETEALPHRFFLENLSILQPVTVTLIARNPGDEIRLALGKYNYEEPDRRAATGADGSVTERLRTQGELKIEVAADGPPKPYLLAVWAGKEVEPDLAPVLVAASTAGAGGGGGGGGGEANDGAGGGGFALGGSPVLWVIAVVLLGILALLAKIAFRKGDAR